MKMVACLIGILLSLPATSAVAAPAPQCLALFDGKENAKHSIDLSLKAISAPIRVVDSPLGDKWLWLVVLGAEDCAKAPKATGYLGQSMTEFMKLPDAQKARFLKVRSTCVVTEKDEKTRQVPCTPAWGDKKADPHGVVYFPVNFVNPPGLRYPMWKDGKVANEADLWPTFPVGF